MFTYEGKPLSFLEFNFEPTTFEGGKSVYYQGKDNEILNTTIVAGYRSNAMFQEGCYGITTTGDEVYYPAEIVDWNFKLVCEYLTEKYPELFKCSEMWYPKLSTHSEDCLITRVPLNQEFDTIAVGSEDEVRISKDRFIKYGALRVEHLDELAKEVEIAMKSKDESKDEVAVTDKTSNPTIVSEADIVCVSDQRSQDKPLNKYYVKFHYIDGNGKEQKVETLVHWDTTSIQQLEASLKLHFGVESEFFFEIDYISLINQVVNYG